MNIDLLKLMSSKDLAAECEADWIVNVVDDARDADNPDAVRRIRIRAPSEQFACIGVEDAYGVTAISARLA